MDTTNMDQQNDSLIIHSNPETKSHIVGARPKLYLLRHAESQAKEYNHRIMSHIYDLSIVDPKLTKVGHKECLAIGSFLHSQGAHITHILSAPLSRTLETACETFGETIKNGVKVLAIPELQSMDKGPNGTGMTVSELKRLYGDESQSIEHCLDLLSSKIVNLKLKLAPSKTDDPQPGVTDIKGDADKSVTTAPDFRGSVDFRFMCEDWNDQKQKEKATNGKYSSLERRHNYLQGFLAGLRSGMREGEPLEVVLITHSSILKRWVAGAQWDTYEVVTSEFGFDKDGNLTKQDPGSRLKRVPVGKAIERHPFLEPLKVRPPSFSKSGELHKQRGFLDGKSVEVPDDSVLRKITQAMVNKGTRRSKSLNLSCSINLDG